jgi:cytidylate kinase
VATQLDWLAYDRELLDAIAQDTGMHARLLQTVDEKPSTLLAESLSALLTTPAMSGSAYAHKLAQTISALGTHGQCVILGRGASLILPPATTLRVRLIAPRDDRIARVSRQLNLTPEEAGRRVDKTDRERTQFVQQYFRQDPTDVHLCDLVLNSARFSEKQCAELIVEALRRLHQHCREQARPASSP